MTGEEVEPVEERDDEEPLLEPLASGNYMDATTLADRVGEWASDLFASVEPVGDHLVRVESMPELLGDALTVLRDKLNLDELLSITVVDNTDLAEGLTIVHHICRQAGGAVMEVRTPYPQEDMDGPPPSPLVPSSVSHWRAADWMEREAWELSGVAFEDHPDLRRLLLPRWWVGHPLRRDGAGQRTVGLDDPNVTPGDKEMGLEGFSAVDLPHAALGGRIGLVVREKDGRVSGARVSVGHLHRGIEGMAEGTSFERVMPLVARTAIRSSVHWQVAYAEAVETLCHLDVPPRARSIRVALMELERIADHMLSYAATLEMLGCEAAASRVWSDRELVMDVSQSVTGQRLVQDAIIIGGVARDAKEGWSDRLLLMARTVQAAVREYLHEAEALEPMARLEGLAPVHLEDMTGWGLTGPLVRATGVPRDARADGRTRAYEGLQVPVQTRTEGDAMARSELRLLEMASSSRTLAQVARTIPGGRTSVWVPDVMPKGYGVGMVEAPGGEVMCWVVSDGTGRPRRVRLRGPDASHTGALADLILGCRIEDVPLAVTSLDICVGGCDR